MEAVAMEELHAGANKVAHDWGWTTPTDDVLKDASISAHCKGKSLADIVEMMGFLTKAQIQDAIDLREESRRKDVSVVDWLSQSSGKLRDSKQRVLCYLNNTQYLPSLETNHLELHPDVMENQDIRNACDRHEAVLMRIQEKETVLVFSDWDISLRQYKQMAGIEAANDPLRLNYPDIKYAVAPKGQVLNLLDSSRQSNVATGGSADKQSQSLNMLYSESLREDPTLRKLANIHDLALELNASDIHIDPDPEGRILLTQRVMGDMQRIPESMDMREYQELKNYLLRKAGATIKFERIKEPKDGMYQYLGRAAQAYVRCSFIPLGHSSNGSEDLISICLRLIPVEHGKVSLKEKGVSPEVIEYLSYAVTPDAGIVLLVGPTGSGKSTTVSGTVGLHEELHGTKKTRFSIEDPVERFLPGITQFQIPYHLRGKGSGFSLILRGLLRHDPNMLWVGEIRDAETAEISVQAASTGHLIISTIHADSATKAVERLSNMVPPDRQDLRNALIENLSLLVAQRLIKKLCMNCRVEMHPSDEQKKYVDYINAQRDLELCLPDRVFTENVTGCAQCRGGVAGRIPVNEVLNVTNKVKAIYLGDNAQNRYDLIEKSVNIKMEDSIMDHINAGRANVESLQF